MNEWYVTVYWLSIYDVQEHRSQLKTEKVLQKEQEREKLLIEQELQKKEKEITEYKKKLESVRKQLETDDQGLSAVQEV